MFSSIKTKKNKKKTNIIKTVHFYVEIEFFFDPQKSKRFSWEIFL